MKVSTTIHPQTNGQAEKMIHTLEDILRAYVLELKGNWDDYLLLIEATYNNNYHSSIEMTPF